jgi:putative glutamine amidotransferase
MSGERALTVGITADHRTPSRVDDYRRWLHSVAPEVGTLILSHTDEAVDTFASLDGVVFTGGGDVHPKYYGRDDAIDKAEGVIRERDVFELKLIERVLERGLPLLAVCRGMQTLNVALGGSLLVDVATAGFTDHRGPGVHPLLVDPHAMMHFAAGTRETEVNTSHHQAVDRLGAGLRPSAFAPDGVIEAVEWNLKEGQSFLLGVQWHPERLPEHPMSKNIAMLFLREAHIAHHRV